MFVGWTPVKWDGFGIFVCRWLVANPQADTAWTRVLRSFRGYVETTVLQSDKTGRNAPMANHPKYVKSFSRSYRITKPGMFIKRASNDP